MQIRSTWRRTAAVVAAGALVLTACSGGDDDDPAEEGTETGAESTDEATEEMTDEATEDEGAAGDVTFAEGVTEEPCPEAVNPDNGCIYLGSISDLTEGPFAALGGPITEAQAAFWNRVNEEGGVGGAFDVDVETYVRDNKYNPETHNQLYQEIKPEILALAQTLGSPTTAAIADDLVSSNVISVPASWTSAWEFNDAILESGNNYCVESSNGLDFWVEQNQTPGSVLAVHYPGDYGWDGAAGAQKWAAENDVEFAAFEQAPGGPTEGAISQIVTQNPDVVVLTVAPAETAAIVGGAAAQGYTGFFLGNSPTWNVALLDTPAAEALQALYWQIGPWGPWDSDTPAHEAMREALGLEAPVSDGYTAGWAWSYPLLAALETAVENGDLTREGVANAVANLGTVDYEGMLPEEAGNFAGTPQEQSFNATYISAPDPEAASGVSLAEGPYEGPTASSFPFEAPCFVEEGFSG